MSRLRAALLLAPTIYPLLYLLAFFFTFWSDRADDGSLPIETDYDDYLINRGREQGRQEGRREGRMALLMRQLERRFGPLEPEVRRRVEALDSADEVEKLAERVLDARSLEEMGLA